MKDHAFELAAKMERGEQRSCTVGVEEYIKIKNYLSKRGKSIKAYGLVLIYLDDTENEEILQK